MQIDHLLHKLHMFVHRQLQTAEDIAHHLRAKHLVLVEGPTNLLVVGLGKWLGNVVQNGRPSEPQIVAAAGYVIQHLQRMAEVILMGVVANSLHTFEAIHFGKDNLQQACQIQQIEAD